MNLSEFLNELKTLAGWMVCEIVGFDPVVEIGLAKDGSSVCGFLCEVTIDLVVAHH